MPDPNRDGRKAACTRRGPLSTWSGEPAPRQAFVPLVWVSVAGRGWTRDGRCPACLVCERLGHTSACLRRYNTLAGVRDWFCFVLFSFQDTAQPFGEPS